MSQLELTLPWILTSVVAAPASVVLVLIVSRWTMGRRAPEKVVSHLVGVAFGYSVVGSASLLVVVVATGLPEVSAHLGSWFSVEHYQFEWTLIGDRLSLTFSLFVSVLSWTIASFSRRYLHREEGFHRFYLMLTMFGSAVLLVVTAGSLDLIFFGWEIVGLTSALLIAFFHDRRGPVENGLRTFATYRFCDVGVLAAAAWLHHSFGSSRLSLVPGDAWAMLPVPEVPVDVLLIGLLLIWGSMGKAAQFPLGGWLPRAMEGPTPSSAIFYGAISVHLGPFLLLRSAAILESNEVLGWCVVAIGFATALHATFVGRVQTDIKSLLAYASMTQLGLIYVEIGLGLDGLAVVHIVGHATLRALQILRSPSLLHDHHHLEQQMGGALPRTGGHLERLVPEEAQRWLYRLALERGYLDALIVDRVVGGSTRLLLRIDAVDRRFADWLGGASTPSVDAQAREPLEGSR